SWVHKKRTPYNNYKDLPSKFKLIYRASRDGFGINNFHENCDNKESTVVVIKIRDSGEIIGGYNPLEWRSIKIERNETSYLLSHNQNFYNDYKCKASNSFIFSLANQNFPILSRISSKEEAIIWCRNKGPCFGLQDLCIKPLIPSNNFNVICVSKQHSYEKKIINGEIFEIEEYEVFQIDRGFSHKMFQFIVKFPGIILLSLLLVISFYVICASEERGFSYRSNSPLDMRINQNNKINAEEIINNYSQEKLADIFYYHGEERKASLNYSL
ncbi:hypothetical protein RhiirA4_475780, partial [Rhizophagus irregularis]